MITEMIQNRTISRSYKALVHKAYCKISTWKDSNKNELVAINGLKRQALHAYSLAFNFDNEDFEFYSELPQDIEECISNIQE